MLPLHPACFVVFPFAPVYSLRHECDMDHTFHGQSLWGNRWREDQTSDHRTWLTKLGRLLQRTRELYSTVRQRLTQTKALLLQKTTPKVPTAPA